MAKYTRKQVLDEAKKLATMLANTEEIDRFKKVEAKINENKKVQQLMTKIKALQKQAVNLQAYEKTEALNKVEGELDRLQEDRKSTRLNSSHVSISYAVFCLKKKK